MNTGIINKATKMKDKRIGIQNAIKNNSKDYYHFLPRNSLFEGGYINFRKVITYPPEDFLKKYGQPKVKVQEYFVKNILNRFSAYYARQGQPDFNFKLEADAIISNTEVSEII